MNKNMKQHILLSAIILVFCNHTFSQNEIELSPDGVIVPRVDRTTIASPAAGQLIYDINSSSFWFHNGVDWHDLLSAFLLQDSDDDTKIEVEANPDEDKVRFRIGGTEYFTMDTARLAVFNSGKSIFIGENAGQNDDLSDNINTFVGFEAGKKNSFGQQNTAVGGLALKENTFGSRNSVYGYGALISNISGGGNSVLGNLSMMSNMSGKQNSAFGEHTLSSNKSGSYNLAIGTNALYSDTSSNSNVAIGVSALHWNVNRSNLVAVGDSALYWNSTGASMDVHGSHQVAVGSKALLMNTTGSDNTAIGFLALRENITGQQSVAVGAAALLSNIDGSFNTAIGTNALASNNSGKSNVAVGLQSLMKNIDGAGNTSIGRGALRENNTGDQNVALGYQSGLLINGDRNTLVGYQAGYTNSNGTANVLIGYKAGYDETGSNKLYISNSQTSPPLVYGEFDNKTLSIHGRVGIGTNSPEVMLHASGGDVIIDRGSTLQGLTRSLTIGGAKSTNDTSYAEIIFENYDDDDVSEYIGAKIISLNPTNGSNRGDLRFLTAPNATAPVERMRIEGQGNVGIDCDPNVKFQVGVDGDGSVAEGNAWNTFSDRRYKSNIETLQNASEVIAQLHGRKFIWNYSGNQDIGFVAQEVEAVLPEIVHTNEAGYKSLDYAKVTPLLVEAIKEQNRIIEEQQQMNNRQQKDIAELKRMVNTLMTNR